MAESQVIMQIAPQELVPDPNNPRGKLRFIDELAENILANGLLEPLVVREVNGKLQIMSGHRRQAAAIKAKMPVVDYRMATVEDERIYAMQRLVSNSQRDDLSPVEHAQGIQQVLDLGATEDEVAKGLSIPVAAVQQSSTIAKAKKVVKEAPKHADLTFDQVLGLAEFEGDDDIYANLLNIATESPEEWPYEIEHHRQQRARDDKFAADAKVWKDKGYEVQTQGPRFQTNERYISRLVGSGKNKEMTAKDHATCPGRAIHLSFSFGTSSNTPTFTPMEMCLDFVKHGHKETNPSVHGSPQAIADAAASGTDAPTAADDQKSKDRKINLAMISAGKVAEVVRRDFVAGIIARKVAPKGTLKFAALYVTGRRFGNHQNSSEMLGALAGDKYGTAARMVGSRGGRYFTGEQQLIADGTEAQIPLGLFGAAAAEIEGDWQPNTWKGENEERAEYLRFLVSCGYKLSLVEQVSTGKVKPEAVWTDQEERKARAKGVKAVQAASKKTATPPRKAPAKPVKKTATAKKRAPAKRAAKKAVKRAPAKR